MGRNDRLGLRKYMMIRNTDLCFIYIKGISQGLSRVNNTVCMMTKKKSTVWWFTHLHG